MNGTGKHLLGTSTWTGLTGTNDYSLSGISVAVDGAAGTEINGGSNIFMMIPQTLPDGASIEVTIYETGTGTTQKLTADISGQKWPMGKTVVYKITSSSIDYVDTFSVSIDSSFTYTGGTIPYTVTSKHTLNQGGVEISSTPLAWTAKFVEDNGSGVYTEINQPSWVTEFTTNGNGGDATNYDAGVKPQYGTYFNEGNDALKNADAVSNYDLSTNGGTTKRNTANSYVVNAPGTYSFPLAYGNAIKDGATNDSSYTYSSSESDLLTTFMDYKGKGITKPYIYDTYTPGSAELVWQDALDLVTDVTLSSDGHSIEFKVDKASICQGNAVIAVKDKSGTIMWSWHIWVTDYKLGDDLKSVTSSGSKLKFMPINFGWCSSDSIKYAARNVSVLFTQEKTGKTSLIKINQEAYDSYTYGDCPYYQWGRKDPMLPSDGAMHPDQLLYTNGVDKTAYDKDGNASDELPKISLDGTYEYDSTRIVVTITSPRSFIKGGHSGTGKYYTNLWSNGGKKTIYDPSPAGYKLPLREAFDFMVNNDAHNAEAKDINDNNNIPDFNGYCDTLNHQYVAYCDNGDKLFLPLTGLRISDTGNIIEWRMNGGIRKVTRHSMARSEQLQLIFDPHTDPNNPASSNHNFIYSVYAYSLNTINHGYTLLPVKE